MFGFVVDMLESVDLADSHECLDHQRQTIDSDCIAAAAVVVQCMRVVVVALTDNLVDLVALQMDTEAEAAIAVESEHESTEDVAAVAVLALAGATVHD